MFHFRGELILSKSWLNRALIIQGHHTNFSSNQIDSSIASVHSNYLNHSKLSSLSDDVWALYFALLKSTNSVLNDFDLGQGGTSFRFFCLYQSRKPGLWKINAHSRLLQRPQQELQQILRQLDVQLDFSSEHVTMRSRGWKIPKLILCQAHESSQFASALLLNLWNLETEVSILIQSPFVSVEYFQMTVAIANNFGLGAVTKQTTDGLLVTVPAQAKPNIPFTFDALKAISEVDVSSAFSIVSAAAINGHAEITNWRPQSSQPDMRFLSLFDQMQINYIQTAQSLIVKKQVSWKSVNVNLNSSPDLFPVLAVLCALAKGESKLYGAHHLRHKESNRLTKTKVLLDLVGVSSQIIEDGLLIQGGIFPPSSKLQFDPDHDHRMSMAAGLLKLAGVNLEVLNPDVVTKSYPKFWKDIGLEK